MNKILKRILIGIAAFILFVVAAVVVLLIVIDPNDYKDEISKLAYDATGYKIEFKGDIGLKIFPKLGFSIKDVSVDQAGGFGDAPLAHVNELSLRMALLPLLKKQVQVDAVTLDGLNVTLLTDAKGRNNWDVAPAGGEAPQGGGTASTATGKPSQTETPAKPEDAASPSAETTDAEKQLGSLLESSIGAVHINNCAVNYENRATKERAAIDLKTLELTNVGLNRDIGFIIDVAAEMGKDKIALITNGSARYDMKKRHVELDLKSFAVSGEAPEYIAGRQEVKGKLKAMLDGAKSEADIKAVLESAFVNGNADIVIDAKKGKGSVDFKTKPVVLLKALSPEMRKSLELPPELMADNGPLRSLDAKLGFNSAGNNIDISTAEVRLGGSEMIISAPAVKLVFAEKGGLASADGSVSIKGNLRPYLPLAGIEPGKGGAFGKLDAGLAFKLAGDNLTISNLKLLIDDKLLELASPRVDVRMAPPGPYLPINSARASMSMSAKPRELMNGLGMELKTADPKALESFSASFDMSVDTTSLKLDNFKSRLDETDITAMIEMLIPGAKNMPKGVSLYAKGDLQVGTINLDRYMEPESASSGQPAPASGGGQGASPAGPAQPPLKGTALENAYLEFNAGIRSLTVMKAPVQDITLGCVLSNGVLNVSRASLKTFDGQFDLSARANLVNAQGAGALKAKLSGLDMGKALVTMFDEKRLTGKAESDFDFTFKGSDSDTILRTLNGKGKVMVREGELRDFQLIPADAPALLTKHRQNNYQFKDFGGSFTVVDGKLRNNDLAYSDKHMSMTGGGTVTLVDGALDYSCIIKTKETGSIPIKIRGTVTSPKIGIDQEAMAKMAVDKGKEKLVEELQGKGVLPQGSTSEERREALQQDVNEKLNKELERGLNKLLKK